MRSVSRARAPHRLHRHRGRAGGAAALVAAVLLTAGGAADSLRPWGAFAEPVLTSRSASLVAVATGAFGSGLSAGLEAPHALTTP